MVWLVCCYCTSNALICMKIAIKQKIRNWENGQHMHSPRANIYKWIAIFMHSLTSLSHFEFIPIEKQINFDLWFGNGSNETSKEIKSNFILLKRWEKWLSKLLSTNSFNFSFDPFHRFSDLINFKKAISAYRKLLPKTENQIMAIRKLITKYEQWGITHHSSPKLKT